MPQLAGIDGYEFRVRLLPSIVAGLPLLVALLFCFPSLRSFAPSAALAALLVGCASLLSEFTRAHSSGSDIRSLPNSCGARLLMWGDDEIDPRLKKKIHAALSDMLPDYPLLNAQEEKLDLAAAATYCADIVTALTPSFSDQQRYPMIQAGLISSGFRRTIFELKSYVLWSARAGAVLALACTVFDPAGAAPPIICLIAACICTGTAVVFDEAVSPNWVCAAERDYVRHLLLGVISASREPLPQPVEAFDF